MSPKNIKLGPGALYYQTPEGLQPLGPVVEAEEAEEWETEWPKENPYIKATPKEVTLSAEVKINPEVAKAFTALGEACKQFAEALGKAIRAAADCVVATARGVDIAQLLKAAKVRAALKEAKVRAALKEAPPRVRHLAKHGKKYRTRKKNINRALREYERRAKK